MNLLNFHKRFPDEQACRLHLRQQREQQGITCRKCNGHKHYWIQSIEKWRCASCKACTNLRSGTMMECSNLPLLHWFMAIHLMTSTKKSFSALEMQRQLGLTRYEPVWRMMTKIRAAMGRRDDMYKLTGTIEVDDSAFIVHEVTHVDALGNRETPGKKARYKRGRGSEKRINVLIMVESKYNPKQDNPHKKDRSMGYVKMKVLDGGINKNAIGYEIRHGIHRGSHIITDGYRGYSDINVEVAKHTSMIVPLKEAHKKLPWVHTVISNAKRMFLGTHHSISKEYLQAYLDEYCYKLNRRYFQDDLFDRMLTAGLN